MSHRAHETLGVRREESFVGFLGICIEKAERRCAVLAVSPKSLPTKLPRLGCQWGVGADSPEGEQRVASWGAWEVRGHNLTFPS